ncbi:glycoside hydrolase family 3 protein [Desulforhopalus singaporensis]|uniref:Beta-N-acetylhexosaminidase n=1 Tax=Desulforhopalus singaporensis TaxID=91360 RepID=A0A1H0UNX5_9BACT|nr:glycoside hydrolase family 3 N-terminal domain-containing protein [Desulforhopalus singaporensis]SDP67844.1 beta-N-acetylhexosaminidase [Desulforhopalus singaporensis]
MVNLPPLKERIGQLFILGFQGETLSGDHPIVRNLREDFLGGVILFDRHLASRSKYNNITGPTQIKQLTAALRANSPAPLIIAVDQEGGRVGRFRPELGFVQTTSAATMGSTPEVDTTANNARITARLLKEAGINFNLAPVVDLNVNPENPVIGRYKRSFSRDADRVISHSRAWIKEHRRLDICSCIKHFPGHGSSVADSHLGFVDISTTWQKQELQPYQTLIDEGEIEAVMIGHLYNAAIDPLYPATLSYRTVTGLLRRQLNFSGLIVSDDMQMKAITDRYGLEEACCLCLKAGIDMIIIGNNLSHDKDILPKVQNHIMQDIDRGKLDEKIVNAAWANVQKVKKILEAPHVSQ